MRARPSLQNPLSKTGSSQTWSPWMLLCLALPGLFALSCQKPEPPLPPDPPPPSVNLEVGLSLDQSVTWRTLPEGSDLAPVAILRALKDIQTGRLYIDGLDHYGFIPSPASEANPYGLPIGWATHVPFYSPFKQDYVSINCAACHTAQIEYDGTAMLIDGGSNMADIEALALSVKDSTVHMLKHPLEALAFVYRLLKLKPPTHSKAESLSAGLDDDAVAFLENYAQAADDGTQDEKDEMAEALGRVFSEVLDDAPDDKDHDLMATDLAQTLKTTEKGLSHIRDILRFLRDFKALIKNRLELAQRALKALEITEPPGPGRDDPWGIIRNVFFASGTVLDSPTSIPALYHAKKFPWYHADSNTNSVMQRDIAQAVALGGFVDPETKQSSLLPRNIWRLEEIMRTMKSPAWPEAHFGPLDEDKVARGQALFAQLCQECHTSYDGFLMTPEAVGTDPNRAESVLRDQDGVPFYDALVKEVEALENTVYTQAGISQEEIDKHNYNGPPEWRGTGKYQSRPLDGIWSTAPYLHNGSVPTLYDLLLPADQRPASFQLGDRNYDPKKVGYVTEVENPRFTFQNTSVGGANSGHEYGVDLSDEERWDLVEYLKSL